MPVLFCFSVWASSSQGLLQDFGVLNARTLRLPRPVVKDYACPLPGRSSRIMPVRFRPFPATWCDRPGIMPVLFPFPGVVRNKCRRAAQGVVQRAGGDPARVGHVLHPAGRAVGVGRDEGRVGAGRGGCRAETAGIMPVLFRPSDSSPGELGSEIAGLPEGHDYACFSRLVEDYACPLLAVQGLCLSFWFLRRGHSGRRRPRRCRGGRKTCSS